MKPPMEAIDVGSMPYLDCLEMQRDLVDARCNDEIPDMLILAEHDPVITLGRRRTASSNVLTPGDIPVVEVERGGDATFHGPGQIVGYPIFKLQPDEQDLHRVLRRIEEALVRVLAQVGLEAGPKENHTGVWCGSKKLVSVGVAVRQWVTYHGFALNVDTDLAFFERINPCGLEAQVMSSIVEMGGKVPSGLDLKEIVCREIARSFERRFPGAA